MGMDIIMVRTCMSPMDIMGTVGTMDMDTATEGQGPRTYGAAKGQRCQQNPPPQR